MTGRRRRDAFSAADVSVPLVILRRRSGGYEHGPLAVARSAGRLGIAVHGVFGGNEDPAGVSRFVRGRLTVAESATNEQRLEALMSYGRRLGRSVLVPLDDSSAVFVTLHAAVLREIFLFADQRGDVLRSLSNKQHLHERCLRLGIPTPDHALLRSEADVADYAQRTSYPVVAKVAAGPSDRHEAGVPGVVIANSRIELIAAWRRMQSTRGSSVLVQEYIPGEADSTWIFNGYFDAQSACVAEYTGQKLRNSGPDSGPATVGVCRWNPTVAELTKRLTADVGYRGVVDADYRYDGRDGSYKLLDFNPRVGSTFRLFVAENGLDVLRALYLDLTGQAVPRGAAHDGRKWLDEPHDLLTSLQLRRQRQLRLAAWARSLRGVQEAAWFAADDPRPFLSMWAGMLPRVSRKLLG